MSPETSVSSRLRSCRSGISLKRGLRVPVSSLRYLHRLIATTLQPSLGWETPGRGRSSDGSRLCWQISIASFVVSEKFSVSILASFQKWDTDTQKNHGKNYRKSCHSANKSPCHRFRTERWHPPHVVQVREFWFWQSQRQQDLLQRLFLGTGLHSLHWFALDIHSFTHKQRYNCDCQVVDFCDLLCLVATFGVCDKSSLKSPSSLERMDLGFNVSTKSTTYIAFFRWI